VPYDGELVRWRARFLADQAGRSVALTVLRPVGGGYKNVWTSSAPGPGVPQSLAVETGVPVKRGDLLSIRLNDGGHIGIATHAAPDAELIAFVPALANDSSSAPDEEGTTDAELLLNADIEADADGDGHGDETRDRCPESGTHWSRACGIDIGLRGAAFERLQMGRRSLLHVSVSRRRFPANLSFPAAETVVTLDAPPGLLLLGASAPGKKPCDVSPRRVVCEVPGGLVLPPIDVIEVEALPDPRALTRETWHLGLRVSAFATSATRDLNQLNNAANWPIRITAPNCGVPIPGTPRADRLTGTPFGDQITGGRGRDVLVGGPARDCLSGGRGNDLLVARDGRGDTVNCGPGDDRARVDRLDVTRRCEHVRVRRATSSG
jgi:hypothetical protein